MINFPNSPIQGQVFTSTIGLQYVWLDGVWRIVEAPQDIGKAESRNRIVNGAMQVSQEWGNTLIGTGYPVDQWQYLFSTTGAVNAQRVQVVTPNKSANRLRFMVGTADTSLAAGEYWLVLHNIEGIRVADFGWGAVGARQAVLRFGWKSPAGTYSFALRNSANARSYIANFTISAGQANTDTEQTFVIPGDTTGTWLTDTGIGLTLLVCMACGTTFQGVAGWQAGSLWATAANTNGLATVGNTFELFDVGLYLDPLNSGIAPPWQMPDEAQELAACQRYYYRTRRMAVQCYMFASNNMVTHDMHPVVMRTTPVMGAVFVAGTNVTGTYSAPADPKGFDFALLMGGATTVAYYQYEYVCSARM